MFGGFPDEDDFQHGFFSAPVRGTFQEQYRAFSTALMSGEQRKNVNYGGKIILPPSALLKLSNLHIDYPMVFEIRKVGGERATHAGVLEFIAEEGRCYMPHWAMRALGLDEGNMISIKNTNLVKGRFVKIQPQSVDFLDIHDPKAVLENAFRNFSTLTEGDIVTIHYNDKVYDIQLLQVKPAKAVSILETDLEVDFAAPVGYEERRTQQVANARASVQERISKLTLSKTLLEGGVLDGASSQTASSGQRLDGKPMSAGGSNQQSSQTPHKVGDTIEASDVKDGPLRLPVGKLFFGYPVVPLDDPETKDDKIKAFQGEGGKLRTRKGKGRAG